MTAGWVVAVLVEVEGEPVPQRRYFIVAQADRARAEWSAIDCAMLEGPVATSPVGGLEPVEAIQALPASILRSAGVASGAAKALGARWPRRWIGVASRDPAP